MAVTVFIFDAARNMRRIAASGIVTLIHDERNYTLTAEMDPAYGVKNGEYIGFTCVDGRFRLFRVDRAETDDYSTTITATEEAVSRLVGTTIGGVKLEGATAAQAIHAILNGRDWTLGTDASGGKTADIAAQYTTAWKAITDAADLYNVRAVAHYELNGRLIGGKIIDLVSREPVYRGRFIERGVDGEGIVVSFVDVPRPRIVAYGAQLEDGTRLTIAGAAWSKADGAPADKPGGQIWISDPEAERLYGDDEQILDRPDIEDVNELIQAAWEAAQKVRERRIRASATMADMEMIAGQTHKAVRLWDYVRVRTKYGDVMAQVIEIKRDYIRPDQTKITIGEDAASSAKQIARLTRSAQLAAAQMQAHDKKIEENAEQILLRATLTQVQEFEDRTETEIGNVWLNLDAKASAAELVATNELISENDAYYTRQFTQVGLELDAKAGVAELSAVRLLAEGTEEDLKEVSVRLDAAEGDITLKADKVYVDAELTSVRTLIAEEVDAMRAEIDNAYLATISTNNLFALNFTLGGDNVSKTQISVITSIDDGTGTTYDLLTTADGGTRTVQAGSADAVYSEGVQATRVQGAEYTGVLYEPGEVRSIRQQGTRFDTALFYAGAQKTVALQGSQYYGAYEDGGEETVTLQGSEYTGSLYDYAGNLITIALFRQGGNRTFYKRGSGISEPLYRDGGKLTYTEQGEEYTGVLHEPGSLIEIAEQGAMLEVPLFNEGAAYSGGLYTNFKPATITLRDVTALTA